MPGIISFDSTGAWNDWKVIDVSLTFVKGNNSLILKATTAPGLSNIDQIDFITAGLSLGNCRIITGLDEEKDRLSISLFPNPSNKDFNLILPDVADVKVMNMQGVTIDQVNQVKDYQFGESYVSGIYLIQISSNGSIQNYKVVKK